MHNILSFLVFRFLIPAASVNGTENLLDSCIAPTSFMAVKGSREVLAGRVMANVISCKPNKKISCSTVPFLILHCLIPVASAYGIKIRGHCIAIK